MIGVVVVTHGQLATELVNAAETIVGDLPTFTAVSIGWHEDVQDARNEIAAAIAPRAGAGRRADRDRHVRRHAVEPRHHVSRAEQVEVVTGVNLPMLIKAANLREQPGPHRGRADAARARPERDLGGVGSPQGHNDALSRHDELRRHHPEPSGAARARRREVRAAGDALPRRRFASRATDG